MPMASKLLRTIEEDSDDILQNFNSSQWGEGTSKVIAQHYNTVQHAAKEKPSAEKRLTAADFKALIAAMQASRGQKKSAKQQGAHIDIQRKELEVLVSAEKDEVEDLDKLVHKL